jgi:hypothetical protein
MWQWEDRFTVSQIFGLRRMMMKTAFGILALYVSIPLAIVAAQSIVAHEAAQQQRSAHAAVAQVVPAAVVVARH